MWSTWNKRRCPWFSFHIYLIEFTSYCWYHHISYSNDIENMIGWSRLLFYQAILRCQRAPLANHNLRVRKFNSRCLLPEDYGNLHQRLLRTLKIAPQPDLILDYKDISKLDNNSVEERINLQKTCDSLLRFCVLEPTIRLCNLLGINVQLSIKPYRITSANQAYVPDYLVRYKNQTICVIQINDGNFSGKIISCQAVSYMVFENCHNLLVSDFFTSHFMQYGSCEPNSPGKIRFEYDKVKYDNPLFTIRAALGILILDEARKIDKDPCEYQSELKSRMESLERQIIKIWCQSMMRIYQRLIFIFFWFSEGSFIAVVQFGVSFL